MLLQTICSNLGIGNLRLAGKMRSPKGELAPREHFLIITGMRPVKGKTATLDHKNLTCYRIFSNVYKIFWGLKKKSKKNYGIINKRLNTEISYSGVCYEEYKR